MVEKREIYIRDRWTELYEILTESAEKVKKHLEDKELSVDDLNRKCGTVLRVIGYSTRSMSQFAYRVRRKGTVEGHTLNQLASELD